MRLQGKRPIPVRLRRAVRARAEDACEYCRIPEGLTFAAHEVDHIIAVKHGGTDGPENLALSCLQCNRHKGSDLTSVDPWTRSPA